MNLDQYMRLKGNNAFHTELLVELKKKKMGIYFEADNGYRYCLQSAEVNDTIQRYAVAALEAETTRVNELITLIEEGMANVIGRALKAIEGTRTQQADTE